MRRFILAATTTAAFLAAPLGAQSVSNTVSTSQADAFEGLGANLVPTVGETFTVPVGVSYLNTFSFFLANDPDNSLAPDLQFKPYVMSWSTDHPTGTNLLSLSPVYMGNATSTFLQYTFAADVPVTPGAVYVAFLTTSGVPQSGNGANEFAGATNYYSGGQLVYAFTDANGTNFTSPSDWYDGAGAQLGFDAEFSNSRSTVPEPSQFLLLGSGLGSLLGVVRVRRRKALPA